MRKRTPRAAYAAYIEAQAGLAAKEPRRLLYA